MLAAIALVGVAGAASLPAGVSTGVALPANAFFGPFSFPPGPGQAYFFGSLSSVACPPSGSCVAVGSYASGPGPLEDDAMVLSELDGIWNEASEIVPPSPVLSDEARLDSVACPAAGSCVAVGAYLDSANEEQMMAVSESGGVWGQAIKIPGIAPRSIACRAPGSCVAIGTVSGDATKMVGVIESGSVWGQPQEIELPTTPEYGVDELAPLTCQVSGQCVTVGSYTDISKQLRAIGVSESNGTWSASEIKSVPDLKGAAHLYSVACPASGSCVATGLASVAFGVSETDGHWGEASPITPSPDPEAELTTLSSVGCPGSGQCFAVGYDETESSFTNAVVAGVSGAGGVWRQAREIAPPPNAASPQHARLRYVACSESESCVAIGEYTDSSGSVQAMAVTETDGEWGRASEIAAPPSSDNQPGYANLELLACPALGTCAALGHYQEESGTWLMAAGMTTSPEKAITPESAGMTTSPQKSTAAFAGVSLVSDAIVVQRDGLAVIKLFCRGRVKCAGSLRLIAKARSRRKRHLATIEIITVAKFAVAPDRTATIKLKLNAVGRSLLKAAHGRLRASLAIAETSPAPSRTCQQSVDLAR